MLGFQNFTFCWGQNNTMRLSYFNLSVTELFYFPALLLSWFRFMVLPLRVSWWTQLYSEWFFFCFVFLFFEILKPLPVGIFLSWQPRKILTGRGLKFQKKKTKQNKNKKESFRIKLGPPWNSQGQYHKPKSRRKQCWEIK